MRQRTEQLVKQDYKKHLEESFIEDYKDWNDYLSIFNEMLKAGHKNKKKKPISYNDFCGKMKTKFDEQINTVNWSKVLTIKDSQFMGVIKSNETSEDFQNSIIKNRLYQLEQKLIQSSFDALISEILDN